MLLILYDNEGFFKVERRKKTATIIIKVDINKSLTEKIKYFAFLYVALLLCYDLSSIEKATDGLNNEKHKKEGWAGMRD